MSLFLLDETDTQFPPVSLAQREPNGLLAVGGDLSIKRLLNAYQHGIFPWFSPGEPMLWWSPDPRAVLELDQLHVSRSLKKTLRRHTFAVSLNRDFESVIKHCAHIPRADDGTWITSELIDAYSRLHQAGHAHSIEVWNGDVLAGGLYGIFVNGVFCGESMFHTQTDASKVAFAHLVELMKQIGAKLIDCQIPNDHLESLGVDVISRQSFIQRLNQEFIPLQQPNWQARELNEWF